MGIPGWSCLGTNWERSGAFTPSVLMAAHHRDEPTIAGLPGTIATEVGRPRFARYDVSERILVCFHPDREFTESSRDCGRLIANKSQANWLTFFMIVALILIIAILFPIANSGVGDRKFGLEKQHITVHVLLGSVATAAQR